MINENMQSSVGKIYNRFRMRQFVIFEKLTGNKLNANLEVGQNEASGYQELEELPRMKFI